MLIRFVPLLFIFVLLAGVLFLSGCSGAKETLGLDQQKAPDEFAVVRRAPLSLPPEYSLRPPVPGAPRPQEVAASDQAKGVVLGQGTEVVSSMGEAEGAFLARVGVDGVDPDIRRKVDAETAVRVDKNKPVVQKILSIGSDEIPAVIVDAKAEAERLKAGDEGVTPSIED